MRGRSPLVRLPFALMAGALMAAGGLAACGSEEPVATSTSPSPSTTSASPTPTPSATSSSARPTLASDASPFSGRPQGAGKPVLAVKIDNTGAAQPQAGLKAADLVYVEEVEWGLTRLIALFSTELPEVVGPVRSARISDIDILAPFGSVAFAYSGAQSKLLPLLAQAAFLDASANASYAGWFNDPARPSPVDHMLQPSQVLDVYGDAAVAAETGWVFSVDPPAGGQPVQEVTATWPDSSVGFRWNEQTGDYIVVIDGADSQASEGGSQHAATVVIQSVEQSDSGYGDKFGGVTPFIQTVGSGPAVVLRDGKLWSVTWERDSLAEPTRYTLPDGSPMPFAIGQQWVVLLDSDRAPIVR